MNHAVFKPAGHRWRLMPGVALAAALSLAAPAVAAAAGRAASSAFPALSPEFNQPGSILVAD